MRPAPIKDLISFEDFEKLDIRIGTIVSVSEIEKSNKLMRLEVDFGDHIRSILAGIKQERENPKEMAYYPIDKYSCDLKNMDDMILVVVKINKNTGI